MRATGLARASLIAPLLALAACGGGGSGGVESTPTPVTPTTTTPPVTPPVTPTVNYDTAEYRASNAASAAGALTAYQAGASGQGVTVGVIDSGISDPTGELAGRISPASTDIAGSRGIADEDGHGTAVSMIVAAGRNDAGILGVAWNATVLALRTDGAGSCASGSCTHSDADIATALTYAVANGAKVVNISLGGSTAGGLLRNAVAQATAAGVIVVIAAGNGSNLSPDGFASSLASVGNGLAIIAMAVDATGQKASFSNGAAGQEANTLAALGVDVATLDANGNLVYGDGTSFATPAIAGAAALLSQAFPNLTPAQIVALLKSSATDAGASGTDSVYGAGILNLAKAFAPQGQTSLAATSTAVTTSAISSLSAPMGDAAASAAGITAVVTDTLGRAYTMNIGGSIARPGAPTALVESIGPGTRSVSGTFAGGRALSLSIADRPTGTLTRADREAPARLLSARMASRLDDDSAIAFGFATSAESLAPLLGGDAAPAFVAARTDLLPRSAFRADRSMMLRQDLGRHLALETTGETGRLTGRTAGRYDRFGMAARMARGPAALTLGIERLHEASSLLGARLAPVFGGGAATTRFATARLDLAAGRWSLSGRAQRGWTEAGAGGALTRGGRLTSQSWSGEIGRRGLFSGRDAIHVRVAQPLRVIASDMPLSLPVAYDYASVTATNVVQQLDLTPAGRERDAEIAWTGPLGDGWLTANLYARTQPGNIAAAPDDVGIAARFRLAF